MRSKLTNRHFIIAAIVIFYLIPLILFSAYSIILLPRSQSWLVVSLGLLLVAGGSLLFMLLLSYWERSFQNNPDERVSNSFIPSPLQPPFPFNGEDIIELQDLRKSVQEYQEQQNKLVEENQELLMRSGLIAQEYADYKIFSEEQQKQKNLQIQNFQKNIEEQQGEFKSQQEHMELLHTKVRDLSYEIKTLLSIGEKEPVKLGETTAIMEHEEMEEYSVPSDKQVHNEMDASLLLKRCINTAQKLTGAYYYGNEMSRYKDFAAPHSAIDLRRLFDSLRMENEALVVVYSPKDQKLLFANNQSKALLGWGPDKLVNEFSSLIQDGAGEWRRAINQLTSISEAQIKMLIKAKNGQDLYLQCHLGTIPTGLFRGYVIGVLYTAV